MHAHFRVCKPPKSSFKNNVLKRFPHTFGRLSTVKGTPDPSTWYSALAYRHAEYLVIVSWLFFIAYSFPLNLSDILSFAYGILQLFQCRLNWGVQIDFCNHELLF